MNSFLLLGLFVATTKQVSAQINAGEQKVEANLPFKVVRVATLGLPWRIASLREGQMLITEKVGAFEIIPDLAKAHVALGETLAGS